ncbi:MAG: phosphodiester glycosidase family protein, partial [Clostridia bacterium]|nr:phosphodiester glycosidase family protein [Clostridia bacterium]
LGLLTALMILWTGCVAAAEEKGEFPALNDAGFLDSGEFVWEDEENGVWRYASDTLRIEIFRRQQKQPARVWYEAEVFCAEGSAGPRMVANDPEHWKTAANMEYPYKIARKNGTVLAISSDFGQLRLQQKKSRPGIIIRDGKVWSDRTKKKGVKDFPNLDCLAIWPDGDMKVYYSNEKTAEEYLADGAIDVLAFGPILIRDGKLNEEALKKYGTSHAQRTAVGMVEKGHYFFMMLEGRIKRSKGDGISFLAGKLMEKGCTLGFNLDGGETACIVFMGHQLCKMKDRKKPLSSRRTSDILGVGTSELLPAVSDPW